MEAVSGDVSGWVINPAVQRLWGQKLFEEAEEFWGLCSEYCLGTPLVSIPLIVLIEPSQSRIFYFQIPCGPSLGRSV